MRAVFAGGANAARGDRFPHLRDAHRLHRALLQMRRKGGALRIESDMREDLRDLGLRLGDQRFIGHGENAVGIDAGPMRVERVFQAEVPGDIGQRV